MDRLNRRDVMKMGAAAGVSAAAAFLVAPGSVSASSGATGAKSSDQDQMVAEAMRLEQVYIRLWHERKWDELGGLYKDDAIALPPNHAPIQGRPAIIDYYKGLRDAVGEIGGGTDPFRATASGNLVSIVNQYTIIAGHVRVTGHELWERQSDGSLKFAVDQFGFRDPQS